MIIGKDSKRGPTFADVKPYGYFRARGGDRAWQRSHVSGSSTAWPQDSTADGQHFNADEPVQLLELTPTELTPTEAPDPALTTYGELEPGEWFMFVDPGASADRPRMRTSAGHVTLDGYPAREPGSTPVRRLTPLEAAAHIAGPDASVVVHAQGETVRRFGYTWRVCGRDGTEILCTDDELRDIVQQGAAALAGGAA